MTELSDILRTTLGDDYTIERELGGGGMSQVFVATDNRLGRRVVIKVLPAELAATVSSDRFRREIQMVARLQHPQIVPIHAAGEAGGLPYLVMPYVEGESLRERIDRGPLSVVETVRILRDVARALGYAHDRGIVHRDIKPDNILLTAGSAVVADFGVAKAISSARTDTVPTSGTLTFVGTSLGTPAYMAPEQVAADPNLDHRADIYAFGIMAYEMLAGSTPFHGRNPQATLVAHLAEVPAPIGGCRDSIPEALCDLVMHCIEKDPAARPASASEICEVLESPAVVSGAFATPAYVSGPSAARRARVRSRRSRAVAIAAAIGVVALGGLAWRLTRADATAPSPPTAVPAATTIAVLPLVYIGADSSQAYLADGITNAIMSALAKIPELRVASRMASAALQARMSVGQPVQGISALLEGTIERQGERLRVAARLVNAADGFTLWSEVYDGGVRDVFALQDDVTAAIGQALRERYGVGTAAPASASPSANPEAYQDYLRGRALFEKRGAAALRSAVRYFQRAVTADPTLALAHAGLAEAYGVLPLYGDAAHADSLYTLGLLAANRAISLDSTLAEAYAARGNLENALWRWRDAERSLMRAIALAPESAIAHQWLGENLLFRGRIDEAVGKLRRASELNPASPVSMGSHAVALGVARRPDSAIALARQAVELDPSLWVTRMMLGAVLLYAGERSEAIRELEAAKELSGGAVEVRGLLGYAYAMTGARPQAEALLRGLEAERQVGNAPASVARIHLGLGDTQRALDWLERAAAVRSPFFASEAMGSPIFDPLRREARFTALLTRVGL